MKKPIVLITLLAILLFAVTACEKDDAKEHAAATTPVARLTDTPAAATTTPTVTATPTDTPAPTVTPTPIAGPDITNEFGYSKELLEKYYAHVDDAKSFLNTLLQRDYAYIQSCSYNSDMSSPFEQNYYNEDDVCIKSTYVLSDDIFGTSYYVPFTGQNPYNRITVYFNNFEYLPNGAHYSSGDNSYSVTYADYVYDEEGRVIELGEYIYQFSPDSEGNLKQVGFTYPTEYIQYYQYTYETDEEGNTICVSSDGKTYLFAPNGNLLSVNHFYQDGKTYLSEKYDYDDSGRLILAEWIDVEKKVWTYNENGYLVGYRYEGGNDGYHEDTEYFYDGNGLLTGSVTSSADLFSLQNELYITKREYYGPKGDDSGRFAGKLMKESSYREEQVPTKDPVKKSPETCIYYSYTTYEQNEE